MAQTAPMEGGGIDGRRGLTSAYCTLVAIPITCLLLKLLREETMIVKGVELMDHCRCAEMIIAVPLVNTVSSTGVPASCMIIFIGVT